MNKMRRKELKKVIEEIEGIKGKLESIQSDEEEVFDAIPENLQGTDRAMNSEEAIDKMSDAITCLEEAIEAIEEIV